MQRYGYEPYHNVIAAVLTRLPVGVYERIAHVDFLCDVDAGFVGFHDFVKTADGRSYRDTAHYWRQTIVLPTRRAANFWTVYHELGHALQDETGYDGHVEPITNYARTDNYEAFAEAFCAWRWPYYAGKDLRAVDPRADAFFESLVARR